MLASGTKDRVGHGPRAQHSWRPPREPPPDWFYSDLPITVPWVGPPVPCTCPQEPALNPWCPCLLCCANRNRSHHAGRGRVHGHRVLAGGMQIPGLAEEQLQTQARCQCDLHQWCVAVLPPRVGRGTPRNKGASVPVPAPPSTCAHSPTKAGEAGGIRAHVLACPSLYQPPALGETRTWGAHLK